MPVVILRIKTVHRTAFVIFLMCLQVDFPQLFTKFYGAAYVLPPSHPGRATRNASKPLGALLSARPPSSRKRS